MFGWMEVAAVLAGFALLVWAADRFVMGAAGLARTLGVSPLIIGLVIVGFGTSAPEMLVGGISAWQGNPGIAVGNALGSNITNIGLVLGVTVLVMPLTVHSGVLRREFPLLLVIMAFVLVLLWDRELSFIDGLLLLAGMGGFIYWMIHIGHRERKQQPDPLEEEYAEEIPELGIAPALLWLVVGLIGLLVGARLVVWGSVAIAQALGVSDLVIGLTIVAIGTSLPELAASIASALKNEHDIAIGNVIGSNMFNLLGVLGIPAVIQPAVLEAEVLTRDYVAMAALTLALFFLSHGMKGDHATLGRFSGGLMLGGYVAYLIILYQMAVS